MKIKDPRTILFFAFRYALGRQTYAPSLVVDEMLANWDEWSDDDKKKMADEIEGFERFYGELPQKEEFMRLVI